MSTEQRLAEVFVELADTLVADFEAVDFLQSLVERTVELLDVSATGILLTDQRGALRVMASSSEGAAMLDLFQVQSDEGPCRDCYRSGVPIVNVSADDAEGRWPAFGREMRAAGFVAAHALPLRLRGELLGALNLFHSRQMLLSDRDVRIGQALADIASISLLHQRGQQVRDVLAEQLQAALNSRIVIEQAKGVLAERDQIPVDEAFDRMRRYARSQGASLSMVAAEVISGQLKLPKLAT